MIRPFLTVTCLLALLAIVHPFCLAQDLELMPLKPKAKISSSPVHKKATAPQRHVTTTRPAPLKRPSTANASATAPPQPSQAKTPTAEDTFAWMKAFLIEHSEGTLGGFFMNSSCITTRNDTVTFNDRYKRTYDFNTAPKFVTNNKYNDFSYDKSTGIMLLSIVNTAYHDDVGFFGKASTKTLNLRNAKAKLYTAHDFLNIVKGSYPIHSHSYASINGGETTSSDGGSTWNCQNPEIQFLDPYMVVLEEGSNKSFLPFDTQENAQRFKNSFDYLKALYNPSGGVNEDLF
jgi:hypothetical protein